MVVGGCPYVTNITKVVDAAGAWVHRGGGWSSEEVSVHHSIAASAVL